MAAMITILVRNRSGEPFGHREISRKSAEKFVRENAWTAEEQPIMGTGDPGEWGNAGWTGLTARASESAEALAATAPV